MAIIHQLSQAFVKAHNLSFVKSIAALAVWFIENQFPPHICKLVETHSKRLTGDTFIHPAQRQRCPPFIIEQTPPQSKEPLTCSFKPGLKTISPQTSSNYLLNLFLGQNLHVHFFALIIPKCAAHSPPTGGTLP